MLQAVLRLKGSTDLNQIQIIKKPGNMRESYLEGGPLRLPPSRARARRFVVPLCPWAAGFRSCCAIGSESATPGVPRCMAA